METQEALTRFLKKCEERGLAPVTKRKYHGYLRHFAEEHPQLPTDTPTIDQFLKVRKETPAHRGEYFKMLQAFYSYLEQFEGITSPVPPKGKVGRPHKVKSVNNPDGQHYPATEQLGEGQNYRIKKLVTGGHSLSGSTSISTAKAVAAFLTSRKVMGVSPGTLNQYHYWFKPFIFKCPLLPTTTEEIEEFLGSVKGEPETRWSYRQTLLALYHFLEKRKWIPKDLITFPRIKVPRKVRRVLSDTELTHLFSFAETYQEKIILTLLIDSKIRATELCTLVREKVFTDHITVEGKTGERDVPINPKTYEMLIQLAPSGPLFRLNGKPMQRKILYRHLHRLMERSGLYGKKLGSHILRHSASVQHMMLGGDLLSLKEELGHTTTSQTEIYGALAFPQVKQKHLDIDVLGKITGKSPLERARCYSCNQEIVLEQEKIKETECPGCHQVGKWYQPDVRTGQLLEVEV